MADGGLPKEVAALNELQLRSFREAFALFDAANDGVITLTDLPMALRTLSLHPEAKALKALADDVAPAQPRLGFIPFCQIAARLLADVKSAGAMTKLFSLWDPEGKGTITHGQLREIFAKLPEAPPLPPEVLDSLIFYADTDDNGLIRYKEFCTRLFSEYDKAVKEQAKATHKIVTGSSKGKK